MTSVFARADYDLIVLGAGAAGLFCAARAGQAGLSVLLIDHARKPAEKVRISGGGRCNFTNLETRPAAYISENPHFAKSALARYTPWDFMDLMARHGLSWHEKTLGQLFCDQKSGAIIQMLLDEAERGGVELHLETSCESLEIQANAFGLQTSKGRVLGRRVVVATGGLSIPKMGATGLAYDLARQFGHRIIEPRAALVPFTFTGADQALFAAISGVSCEVRARASGPEFTEALLFTHRGLSGPAMLQASSYWQPGEALHINLWGQDGARDRLAQLKSRHGGRSLASVLDDIWPRRLVDMLTERGDIPQGGKLAEQSTRGLDAWAEKMANWTVKPAGTEGWRTAEVTVGGVDTRELSSKTMESQRQPGLYFIGECVDVTGWLGGYNFQWAWASAAAAAQAAAEQWSGRD